MNVHVPGGEFQSIFKANFTDNEKQSVTFMGYIPHGGYMFSVDFFSNEKENIPFHLKIFLRSGYILTNSYESGYWGKEIYVPSNVVSPFHYDQDFTKNLLPAISPDITLVSFF
ncbi:uncharacterized protein [Dendropsophus ebraccatus]|uniref:uncharacterized protein isoform X2 n=1 Tax=Dendropsophus ebraccatus TaxID=150705 RepID=UPI0038311730